MANCVTYGCTDVPEQELNVCGATIAGGGQQALIFLCGAATVDAEDWDNETLVAQDISNGLAALFKNIKIGVSAGSPVDQSSTYIAGQPPKTVTYDFTGTWMDENVNETNDVSYDTLNAASGFVAEAVFIKLADDDTKGELIYNTSGGILFKGSKVIPDDNTDSVHYEYNLAWKSKESTKRTLLPTGIFS